METYSTGVHITVDGYRLDAHFMTGLDHLVEKKKKKSQGLIWPSRINATDFQTYY